VTDLAVHVEVKDKAITRAVGAEMRRSREVRGWSRAHLVTLLPSGIGERTLLAYEHGLRALTVPRFTEISLVLGVEPPTMMARGLQQARIYLENMPLLVDLHALLRAASTGRAQFRPIVQWARNALNEYPCGSMEVTPAAVHNLALYMGCTHRDLASYLAQFAPEMVEEQEATARPQ